ncbi:MAG: hypothetical protein RBR96_05035, partial [Candidatus Izemoplasmatales bacterium]|nr:hypothetical protein [Candidatus Izemoplasmatales bacterium]
SKYFAAGGDIDGIILTGGIAYSKYFTNQIKAYVDPIMPLTVYPGEDEMQALVEGAMRVIKGLEQPQKY